MAKKIFIIPSILLLLIAIGSFFIYQTYYIQPSICKHKYYYGEIGIAKNLNIALACTNEELQAGLMYQNNIPKNYGMLFAFPKAAVLSFWMKNTPTPLTIIFLDSNFMVTAIYDMEPFSEYIIDSPPNTQYALEMKQGMDRIYHISIGKKLHLYQ